MTLIEQINTTCLSRYPSLLGSWLPDGQLNGDEYICSDLNNGSGHSYRVNIQSGAWYDSVTGDSGKDPVDLFAAINHLPHAKAAYTLKVELGLGSNVPLKEKPHTVTQPVATSTPCPLTGWELARACYPRITYPWHTLPSSLEQSLKQLARSCAGSDNPIPGYVFCLVAAALGCTTVCEVKTSWREPLIFWCFDLRDSGDGKTPSMWLLATVLERLQQKEQERFARDLKDWDSTSKIERQQERPSSPRGYIISDMTIEGIHADLIDHPTGGLALLLNEASSLLTSQGQYKSGKGSDREAWLGLWDGRPIRIVRSGKSCFIKSGCVQVSGGIQPKTFTKVFTSEQGIFLEDGTVFRGLYTYEPSAHFDLTTEAWLPESRNTWEQLLMTAIEWAEKRDKKNPLVMRLTPAALHRLIAWRNEHNIIKLELPPMLRGFIPKSVSYAIRFAGVLQCINNFSKQSDPVEEITEETIQAGIEIAEYYLGQAVDAVRLLVDEKSSPPQEVSERTNRLARVLESLRNKTDSGRLAVSFIFEHFNAASPKESRMTSARAMGAILRNVGLSLSEGRHHANGKSGVRCLCWDEKTEHFLKQCSQRPQCSQHQYLRTLEDEDFTNATSSTSSNEKASLRTSRILETPCPQQETVTGQRLEDIEDVEDIFLGTNGTSPKELVSSEKNKWTIPNNKEPS